jgi:hypothetical protein
MFEIPLLGMKLRIHMGCLYSRVKEGPVLISLMRLPTPFMIPSSGTEHSPSTWHVQCKSHSSRYSLSKGADNRPTSQSCQHWPPMYRRVAAATNV